MSAGHRLAAFDHNRARHSTTSIETVFDNAEKLMDVDEVVSYEVGKMLCPKCGMEMEHGYLQMGQSVNLGIHWFDRPFEHGEQFLAKKNRIVNAPIPLNIKGFRCPKCKVVVFEYGTKKKDNGGETEGD